MVNILKRKVLYFIKNIVAQILRITCSRLRRKFSGHRTEKQSKHGYNRHQDTHSDHIAEILSLNSDINDIRHLEGNNYFHQNLKNDEQRCQYCLLFIFTY